MGIGEDSTVDHAQGGAQVAGVSPRYAAADHSSVLEAASILRSGGLAACPTETVYGLAVDAANALAVARVYAVKGRPRFNPLIIHVSDAAAAAREVQFTELAQRLAQAFWPGPLTLVLPRRPDSCVCDLASAGLETLAVRAPSHPVMRDLLAAFGGPLAAPSANRSGHVSPTTAAHVAADFPAGVDMILDGGACQYGLESTVLAVSDEVARLLRPGAISRTELEAVAGPMQAAAEAESASPSSPGQLASHYAPRAPMRLNAATAEPGEVLLGFGAIAGDVSLSPSGDLAEAAANLFAALRALDSRGAARICVAPIPERGLGEAINDRLRRAAAPRP